VQAVLRPLEDCGPLVPVAPADGSFPLGATITVTGSVAEAAKADAIRGALAPAVGDRPIRVDVGVLNPELCTVLALLPPAPGDVSIALGFGDRAGPNLSGIYAVGDNPVIDVLVPADVTDGYLWVAVADVTGNLYNLLPNINRPEQALAGLGDGTGDVRRVRVAYSLGEQAADPRKLAFAVDPKFGKSVVIALHTDRPLFVELRPTTESVASFAEALDGVLGAGAVKILSIATQFIDSRG
jgi:eukaryotic-like serine/threonine-protein kinase